MEQLQITKTIAGKLQGYIDANIAESPSEVIEKALEALEKNLHPNASGTNEQRLIERFRKYQGVLKNTTLSELLADRREGLL